MGVSISEVEQNHPLHFEWAWPATCADRRAWKAYDILHTCEKYVRLTLLFTCHLTFLNAPSEWIIITKSTLSMFTASPAHPYFVSCISFLHHSSNITWQPQQCWKEILNALYRTLSINAKCLSMLIITSGKFLELMRNFTQSGSILKTKINEDCGFLLQEKLQNPVLLGSDIHDLYSWQLLQSSASNQTP